MASPSRVYPGKGGLGCSKFKPVWDNHLLCRACRNCNKENPCDICMFWTEDVWKSFQKSLVKKKRMQRVDNSRCLSSSEDTRAPVHMAVDYQSQPGLVVPADLSTARTPSSHGARDSRSRSRTSTPALSRVTPVRSGGNSGARSRSRSLSVSSSGSGSQSDFRRPRDRRRGYVRRSRSGSRQRTRRTARSARPGATGHGPVPLVLDIVIAVPVGAGLAGALANQRGTNPALRGRLPAARPLSFRGFLGQIYQICLVYLGNNFVLWLSLYL